jgi:long-chain fatty acid transport protein
MRKVLTICLVCLIPVAWLFAAGYQIGEHGARAEGMGSAFVAQASDPSAIHFNAAGLGFQNGLNILAGATMIAPRTDFTGPTPSTETTDMVSQNFYIPHAYVNYGMENGLAFGIGLFVPYGLGSEWDEDWVGRYWAVKTELQALYITPTIAYRFSPKLALGAGFSYIMGNVSMSQKMNINPAQLPDWMMKLDGDGTAFTFNAGLLYKATEQLSLGLSYRHLADVELEGDAKFEGVPNIALPSPPYPPGLTLPMLFPDQTGKTTLPLPGDLKAGVAYTINENWLVEADFEYVFWSAFDSLVVEFDEGVAGESGSSQAKEYKNSILLRLGGQYSLEKLSLRAGFVYDQSPVPDEWLEPSLPDANRLEFTFGLGYQVTEKFAVNAAYHLIKAAERTVDDPPNEFPGTYNTTANLVGLSLTLGL